MFVLAALAVGAASSSAAGGTPAYSRADLGTLSVDFKFCTYTSGASAVNDLGVAVGWSKYANNCDDSPAAAITEGGVFRSIPRIPFTPGREPFFSEATAVNDRGQAVGWSNFELNIGTPRTAFLSSGGTTVALGAFCGTSCAPNRFGSEAHDINDAGHVVGLASTGHDGTGPIHAFFYSAGEMTDLGTLGAGTSAAYGINDRDQVVGESDGQAFLFDGVMRGLGTLGGSSSTARAINDAGQIVGYSMLPGDSATHAFLYAGGQMKDLGTLGGSWSRAYDVNRFGQVVGVSATAGDSAVHVFTYSDGVMQDVSSLMAPGVDFFRSGQESAITRRGPGLGVNDLGQIAGATTCKLSTCFNGELHGAVLTDSVAPTCELASTGTTPVGREFVKVAVQDLGSGLLAVHVVSSTNATIETDFGPATPRPIEVTVTQRRLHVAFSAQLEVRDIAGNATGCSFSQPG